MASSPYLARAAWIAVLALPACRTSGEVYPDPGPSTPPPAVAAAPAGEVSEEEVKDMHVARTEELLVGRFPGVEVLALPGGGISVRIRGATSIRGNTEPLYVIDGMPINAEPGGALKWLPPQDVHRIEVLKDPSSTAFYGVRGANGVILITTKH